MSRVTRMGGNPRKVRPVPEILLGGTFEVMMITILRWVKKLLAMMLVVTGMLAIGSALGIRWCAEWLSWVMITAPVMAKIVASMWHAVAMLARHMALR